MLVRLDSAVGDAIAKVYPADVRVQSFLRTAPDFERYQSTEAIDLDGVVLRLGMTRAEITKAIEGSGWRVTFGAGSARWELSKSSRKAIVYFSSDADSAPVAFLVPPSDD